MSPKLLLDKRTAPNSVPLASYCSSKGALINLTRQVALDYASNKIHVNVVSPGMIKTAMVRPVLEQEAFSKLMYESTSWPRLGVPEDIAKSVVILASDAASFMTGSVVNVDGGYGAR